MKNKMLVLSVLFVFALAFAAGACYHQANPPAVSINVPATAIAGSEIDVKITASDDNGLSYIELFDGSGESIYGADCYDRDACKVTFPVDVPSTAGVKYSFTAVAYDIDGLEANATGSGWTYVINPPEDEKPSISITVPLTAQNGSQITLPITATDDNGVNKIQLLDAGNNVLADYICPGTKECSISFNVTVPSANNTAYTFRARAIDAAGQSDVASGSGITFALPVVVPPVNPPVQPEAPEEEQKAGMAIGTFFIENADFIKGGDMIRFFYSVENDGGTALKELTFSASIPELGIKAPSLRVQKLGKGDSVSRLHYIEIPADAAPGTYYLQLSINSKDVRRVVYREFIIKA
jgi:hypothetical protein